MLQRLRPIVAFVTIGMATVACGNSDRNGDRNGDRAGGASGGKEQAAGTGGAVTCTSVDTTPVSLAVREFIARAEPTPQRFLSAFGTDSALPEDGFKVLQDKGPTYFYSSDSTQQRKILDKLAIAGPYASLLVIYRGKTETEGGRAVDVRLAGQYVGFENDGKKLATKRFAVRCDSTGWKIASSAEEPAQ